MNTASLKPLTSLVTASLLAGAVVAVATPDAQAQTSKSNARRATRTTRQTTFSTRRVNPRTKRVSMELRNASVRQALDQLFRRTGADFSLDSRVGGNVTLKVTNQPFERALQQILRGSSQPLTYEVDAGTYFIKPAPTRTVARATTPQPTTPDDGSTQVATNEAQSGYYNPGLQQVGPNTAFVQNPFQNFQVGNNLLLGGGIYGGFGNSFGGPVGGGSNLIINGPGFYNPNTGTGVFYGPNGGNVYNTSRIIFGPGFGF